MARKSSIISRNLAEMKALPLSFLEEITNGFSDEQRIGSSGFAVVYKGKLENITVAVKRMSNAYMYEREFQREVECLMMVKHKNIVKFLGYCADTQGTMARHEGKFVMADVQQRLLCFEYLPKGILHEYITGALMKHKAGFVTLNIGGTLGYLAPEFGNGEITYQFDIYSLGVIILEILPGKKGYQDVDKVVESWSNMLEKSHIEVEQEQVRVCAEIGIECTDFDPTKRPDTQHIINRLNETENIDEYVETGVLTSHQSGSKPSFSLQYLKDITSNFSDDRILGKGSFGVVYKGLLPNGKAVAVKKLLHPIPSSQKDFENEVNILMELKNQNIVRLLGYCYETEHIRVPHERKFVFVWNTEGLICLECLPNGSLDKYISDASSGLNWLTRRKVIEGISYGLQYLREHSNEPIIHLDLKPANILLDANMLPKITDFSLSRLFDQNQTIHTATTRGTLGYMPPEYIRGIITPMWDIFSLGVIIMGVITGHREYPYDIRKYSERFIEIELQKWRNRLQKDPGYTLLEIDCQQIKRCIQIGLICVNDERTKRPTMKKIIDMLEGSESMDWYISNEVTSHESHTC